MNILDFLPIYQNIDSPDFYNSVYRKRELYDNKLSKSESLDIKRGEKFNHQKIISRFLSGYTLYDEILLFHSMGTGKSCTSVGVIEECRKSGYFKRAIIVAPNKALLHNYIEELVYKCTDGKYEPKEKLKKNHTDRMRTLKNNLKNFFSFKTYGELYNDIIRLKINNKSSDFETYKNVIGMYSNTIIVLDEVHNLRPKLQKKEGIELRLVYNEIHKMCMLTRNRKILAMTGTPMRDRPEEISSILNLILPKDSQFPSEDEFREIFLKKSNTDDTYKIRTEKVNELKEKIKGRVSVLQAMESDVLKSFVGETISNFTDKFIIETSEMSKHQTKYYLEALKQDGGVKKDSSSIYNTNEEESSSGIYNNSRQASLFVYPDGSYGSEGFSKYITKVEKKITSTSSKKKQQTVKQYSLTTEFKNVLLEGADEDKDADYNISKIIKNIGKYSSIYKKVIKDLLDNRDKCTYIYSELVTGSGAILLSKLLELVGYQKATGNETDPGLRYAILTSDTSTNADILKIKKMMSDSNNVYGEYIHVIIGSDTTTEGFSLYNIQREHILTPFWNYTKIDQAIARGIRMGSHQFIKQEGLTPEVRIHQHASFPKNNLNDSIHLRMYKISEIKDISIKRMQRVLKESSVDCAFNIIRNKGSIDNSRECEYQKCEYKCDGIDKLELSKEELDISTYNIYYSDDNIIDIIAKLKVLFNNKFIISLEELKDVFYNYSVYQLINSMQRIISENLVIKNKYGIDCFLKEDNGSYFISTNINNDKIITLNYTRTPVLYNEAKDFEYHVNNLKNIYYLNYIDEMTSEGISKSKFDSILSILDKDIQEDILEKCILSKYKGLTLNTSFRERIINYFKDLKLLEYTNEYIISSITKTKRQFDIRNLEWKDYSLDTNTFERIRQILEPTTYKKYYGILDPPKEGENEPVFKISFVNPIGTKVDKRIMSRGTVCNTRTSSFINPIIEYLNSEYNSQIDINKLKTTGAKCNAVKNTLKDLGLLIEYSDLENYKKYTEGTATESNA